MLTRLLSSLTFVGLGLLAIDFAAAAEDLKVTDTPDHVDFTIDGKLAARFMKAHDTSTPERRTETYKPYMHVFAPDGTRLTKGPGGSFPHHRGIFVGYNKIAVGDKKYDRWHMTGGEQVVRTANAFVANGMLFLQTRVDWQGDADATAPILRELRGFTLVGPSKPFFVGIEMSSIISPEKENAILDGDPEHAGAQFRPSEKIDETKTEYLFPGENVDAHKATDLPWAAEIFTVEGKRFTVVILNHPDNPKGTRFSAYRNYGRFGAFPVVEAKYGAPATLRYKWLVAEGEVRDPGVFQKEWNNFTAKYEPTPKLTTKPAEQPAPKKPEQKKPEAPKK